MISDATGNCTDYVQKTSGTTVLDQDRTHNKGNEVGVPEFALVGPLVVPPDEYFRTRSLIWIPEPTTRTALATLAAALLLPHLFRRQRRAG